MSHNIVGRMRKQVNTDAVETLKNISSIHSILAEKPVLDSQAADTSGFMFLSRFNKEESDLPKIKEARQRANDFEEQSIIGDSKSLVSTNSVVSNLEKNRRYALSLATLASKQNKRLQIVQDGAITILIELSAHHDKLIQVRCASAFASLSGESSIRAKMLDEGVLVVLISLATNSNIREIKSDCARAICNLCCVSGYEFKMVKEGVPFAMLNIAAACPETMDICLKTLLNISCIPDKFARIEDVTESLLYFVSHNTLTVSQEQSLLAALCNLSALRNNQLRLVEDGCLRIVEKFYKSKYEDLRRMVCEMLKNFTADSRARAKLLDIDIISVIVVMSQDKLEEIRVLSLKCLYYLSKDRNFRRKIVNSTALALILDACSTSKSNIELGQVASKTLRVLCSDKDLPEKLIGDGVGSAIVSLMAAEDDIIHQYCTESLCLLFQHQGVLDNLLDEGAHTMVVQLAYKTKDPGTSEWCSFALYQLTESSACDFHVMETHILPCILHLCQQSTSKKTKLFCSAALAYATLNKRIDCSAAIALLVSLLDSAESSTEMKKYCATSLFNLAENEANCNKMLEVGALGPVVKLTQASDTKVICAGIVSRLSLHKQYYDQFASVDVLKVLLELSSIDDRLTQRRVVIALSNLSHSDILCQKLLQLNPISYIISLASERDEYLRRGCISIVCNMSYQPGTEKAIVDGGIVPTLMITSLITSDQVFSRVVCVKALVNLMADRNLYPSMVKDGVIWGLSKLSLTEDVELQELSAKALCRLSCTFARDVINSSVAKNTVMKLLMNTNLTIVRPAARILTNLLLATNENDEKFRTDIVENMHPMASIQSDEELNAMCVVCLCLASQSEASRVAIVDSGMLNKIDPSAIFSADHRISYAYITMLNNIANNAVMRTKVLDDHMIERFEKILETRDASLMLAVVQSLYYISCSSENIPKLIDQQILPFMQYIIDMDDEMSTVVMHHLMACLYNLTTDMDVLSVLVSAGTVDVIVQLWPDLVKDVKMAKLALLALCHLSCGKTNSSRIVTDGVTPILCFITEHRKQPQFAQYTFTYDYYLRVSAALRNLLLVVSNQKQMIDEGVLPVLIQMSNQSFDRLVALNNFSSTLGSATPTETKMIRINCAAALKSLTYNKDLRSLLVETEAINIILAEIRKESGLTISQGLLKELEAESWENGARTKQKEGRAKPLPSAPFFMDFLKGNTKVELDFEAKDVELAKYHVQINLDDESEDSPILRSNTNQTPSSPPSISSQESKMSPIKTFRWIKLAKMVTQANFTAQTEPDGGQGLGIEQLRIEDLKPREDADDALALVPMVYGKVEVEVNVDAYALVRTDTAEDSLSVTEEEGEKRSSSAAESNTNTLGGKAGGIPESISFMMQKQLSKRIGSNNATTTPSLSKSSDQLPSLSGAGAGRQSRSMQRTNEQEELSQLVLLINKAKGQEGHVEQVLGRWKNISRF